MGRKCQGDNSVNHRWSLTPCLAIARETNRGKLLFYMVVAEFSILYYLPVRLCNFMMTKYCSKFSRKKGVLCNLIRLAYQVK